MMQPNIRPCLLRLRAEDTEIRFKGMATYERGPEFRKALSSVERLDWHGGSLFLLSLGSSNQY